MSKYKINISYGEEDLNKLLVSIIIKEITESYEL